jgi:hypothetical protein
VSTPTELRALLEQATPGPWRDAETMGAIVSDDPHAIEARGPENFRGYGGAIVAESIERPDRDLIVALRNAAPDLVELAWALEPIADILAAVIALAVVRHDTSNCWPRYGDQLREALSRVCDYETARHEGGGRSGD